MKRRRFIVETLDDSGPYVTTADLLRRSSWLSVVQVAESPDPGARVGFIYDAGNGSAPCHAVLYDKDGLWSRWHSGFCGETPNSGPTPLIVTPQGGLCRQCATYIRQVSDTHWVVVDDAPLPVAPRPAQSHESFEED